MQVNHIPRSWTGHYLYQLFGIPPRAVCGVLIWQAVDDEFDWEDCFDCLDFEDPDEDG